MFNRHELKSLIAGFLQRRAVGAFVIGLISIGVTALAGPRLLEVTLVLIAQWLGVEVSPFITEAIKGDLYTRLIGLTLIGLGMYIAWRHILPVPQGRLETHFDDTGCWLLFGTRQTDGVFTGPEEKHVEGGHFYFQACGHLQSVDGAICVNKIDMRYRVPGPSLLNLDAYMRLDGADQALAMDGTLNPDFPLRAGRGVRFSYVRKVKTHRSEHQCPVDCEDGTIDVEVRYVSLPLGKYHTLKYELQHRDDGSIVVVGVRAGA
jgi:hypothetical protein